MISERSRLYDRKESSFCCSISLTSPGQCFRAVSTSNWYSASFTSTRQSSIGKPSCGPIFVHRPRGRCGSNSFQCELSRQMLILFAMGVGEATPEAFRNQPKNAKNRTDDETKINEGSRYEPKV